MLSRAWRRASIHPARLIRAVAAGCLIALVPMSAAAQPATRHVLFIDSYQSGYPWSDDILKALHERLNDLPYQVELWVEYLDARRFGGETWDAEFTRLLEVKYGNRHLDLIVSSDDPALEFLLKHHDALFHGVPVVFCGVNDEGLASRAPRDLYTGVRELFAVDGMVSLATTLRPATREFVVVTDASTTSAAAGDEYRQLAARRHDLTFRFLDGRTLSLPDIVKEVRRVPESAAVIATAFTQDGTGRYFPRDEGIAQNRPGLGRARVQPVDERAGAGPARRQQQQRRASRPVGRRDGGTGPRRCSTVGPATAVRHGQPVPGGLAAAAALGHRSVAAAQRGDPPQSPGVVLPRQPHGGVERGRLHPGAGGDHRHAVRQHPAAEERRRRAADAGEEPRHHQRGPRAREPLAHRRDTGAAARQKSSCGRRRRSRRWAGSPAASRTTSTTCSPSSPATASWRSTASRKTIRCMRSWSRSSAPANARPRSHSSCSHSAANRCCSPRSSASTPSSPASSRCCGVSSARTSRSRRALRRT